MKYPINEEKINPVDFTLDLDIEDNIKQISSVISGFTGVEKEKIISSIHKFGITFVLSNPSISIIDITKEQETIIKELNFLTLYRG